MTMATRVRKIPIGAETVLDTLLFPAGTAWGTVGSSWLRSKSMVRHLRGRCLSSMVLGINCPVTEEEARAALAAGGFKGVAVMRARRCLTRFKVLL